MNQLQVIGVSTIALGAALGIMPAQAGPAARTLVANIADYNAAAVKAAGDIVTVPDGLATYTVGTGTLEINSRFTVTLPAGFSFSSQPALSAPAPTVMTFQGGGIGSQSITYTVTGGALSGGVQLALSTFAVQGATALESPIPAAAALPITMQSTNNSQITNNDAKPLSAKAFASEPGIHSAFNTSFFQLIDLSSPALGSLFGAGGSDTATIPLYAITLSAQTEDQATGSHAVLSPDGLPNSLATSDTATLTLSGNFNGITAAFASTTADCATPAATGTVTPSAVTLTGVPVGAEVFPCITAGGTTLLQENLTSFATTVAPGTSTDFLGTSAGSDGFVSYTGGGIVTVTNFFTGDDSGYASLLRVNNAGNTPSNLFALVQPDPGGPQLTGSLGSIGGGEGTVFTLAQIEAAVTGLDLANSGQRATLQLIVTGEFFEVKATSLLVNPGGIVDNVGVQPGARVKL